MFLRLGFSIAMHVRPDVLLLDEVLAVGDERFIQKCLTRIAQYRREGGTMLLVTHDAGTVQRLCQRAMLLHHGEVVCVASSHDVIARYHDLIAQEDGSVNSASPVARRVCLPGVPGPILFNRLADARRRAEAEKKAAEGDAEAKPHERGAQVLSTEGNPKW